MKRLSLTDLIKLGSDYLPTKPFIWEKDKTYYLTNGKFLLCLAEQHLSTQTINLLSLLPGETGLTSEFSPGNNQEIHGATAKLLKIESDAIKVPLVLLGGYTVKIKTGSKALVLFMEQDKTVVSIQANYFAWIERFFGECLEFLYSPGIGMIYIQEDSVVKGVVMAIKYDQDEKQRLFEAIKTMEEK